MSILDDILSAKRQEVVRGKRVKPVPAMEEAAREAPPVRPFADALLAAPGCGVIAEVKKASPSKGLIRRDFDPAFLARRYEYGGARCLSVLTDVQFFRGGPGDLVAARDACSLPVLRKDFLVDPWQVIQSRAFGADCILIILAAVDDCCAAELAETSRSWGMDTLFEAHDEEEVDRAVGLNARLMGINNRNLKSFHTDLAVFERLAPRVQRSLLVAESGIHSHADLKRLEHAGARACLVGESLMRARDPGCALLNLLSRERVSEGVAE